MAHTKGKWTAQQLCRTIYIEQENDGPDICKIEARGEAFTEEEYANARLIAAAPELLEALEGLTAFLKDYPHPYKVDISGYLEHAEAVISSTKGLAHA